MDIPNDLIEMQRRQFIAASGMAAASLAGCIGSGTPDSNEEGANESGSEVPDSAPEFELTELYIDSHGCSGESYGVVNIYGLDNEEETPRIGATGGFAADTFCYEPVYHGTEYDAEEDAATVSISLEEVSEEDKEGDCVDCDALVVFNATVEFDGEPPSKIHLEMNGPETDGAQITDTYHH